MMIEVIVASVLMASLAAIFVPGLVAVNRQRLSISDDALIHVELNNIAERSRQQSPASLKLSDWFVTHFPDASLSVARVVQPIPFQTAQSEEGASGLSFDNGLQIRISIPSQHSGLDTSRSLTVWRVNQSPEGASE